AILAGQAPNYTRYRRPSRLGGVQVQIPYIVAGGDGHADSAAPAATKQHMGDTIFESSLKGFGYLLMTATATHLTIEMIETTNGIKKSHDKVTIGVPDHRVA